MAIAFPSGLTAADVPAEITAEAARRECCEGAAWDVGYGYAGGGFGPYRLCLRCGKVFRKTSEAQG